MDNYIIDTSIINIDELLPIADFELNEKQTKTEAEKEIASNIAKDNELKNSRKTNIESNDVFSDSSPRDMTNTLPLGNQIK